MSSSPVNGRILVDDEDLAAVTRLNDQYIRTKLEYADKSFEALRLTGQSLQDMTHSLGRLREAIRSLSAKYGISERDTEVWELVVDEGGFVKRQHDGT